MVCVLCEVLGSLVVGVMLFWLVVVYCGFGVIVCYNLFVLELVGFVFGCLYVGLWSEYFSDFDCLVVIGESF